VVNIGFADRGAGQIQRFKVPPAGKQPADASQQLAASKAAGRGGDSRWADLLVSAQPTAARKLP
jgi:hypothetical protein